MSLANSWEISERCPQGPIIVGLVRVQWGNKTFLWEERLRWAGGGSAGCRPQLR